MKQEGKNADHLFHVILEKEPIIVGSVNHYTFNIDNRFPLDEGLKRLMISDVLSKKKSYTSMILALFRKEEIQTFKQIFKSSYFTYSVEEQIKSIDDAKLFTFNNKDELNYVTNIPESKENINIRSNIIGEDTIYNNYTFRIHALHQLFLKTDQINDQIRSLVDFDELKENLNRYLEIIEKPNRRIVQITFNYILEKPLQLKEICSFFKVKEIDVITMYHDRFNHSGTNVRSEFFKQWPSDIFSSWVMSNIDNLSKYMYIDYNTEYHISPTFLALFAHISSASITSLYLILGFIESIKLYMPNQIYIEEGEYNKLNLNRMQLANSYYTTNLKEYTTHNKNAPIIDPEIGILKPITLSLQPIVKDLQIEKKYNPSAVPRLIIGNLEKKTDIITQTDSFIINIQEERDRKLAQFIQNNAYKIKRKEIIGIDERIKHERIEEEEGKQNPLDINNLRDSNVDVIDEISIFQRVKNAFNIS